jgi:MFS family permease
LTQTLWLYVVFYYILNLGISLSIPTFNALIAQNAEPNTSGEVMGINNSIISLANAMLPVLAASLYGIFEASFYQYLAVLPLLSLMLSFSIDSKSKPAR